MLQDTEYKLSRYLDWYHRTADFRKVMKRRSLKVTSKVKLLRLVLWGLWLLVIVTASLLLYHAIETKLYIWALAALLAVIVLPFVLAYGIIVPLFVGQLLIQRPRQQRIIAQARHILAQHTATKIAVVGSYGKTTAKEILATVLSEGFNVAATPGNMNTPIGISRFARTLKGDEDVLIIEFGEERVGDVSYLADLTQPTMAIITGVNESHLASFKSLKHTTKTIFEIADYLKTGAALYTNGENAIVVQQAKKHHRLYSRKGVNGWHISDLQTSLEGTRFTATKKTKVINAHTKLIGLHTVGVTVAAIDIAESLGMSIRKIESGLSRITPFKHRMEPRQLAGAWIIDDTYNGNSDGVAAGLALLKDSNAKRKVYVTPGLVEQGDKTESVHIAIGEQVAQSADVVVLMKNSVTAFIESGLQTAGFDGELLIIDDPLEFYTNIEHFVAAGDVVLMQNDWTDNYA